MIYSPDYYQSKHFTKKIFQKFLPLISKEGNELCRNDVVVLFYDWRIDELLLSFLKGIHLRLAGKVCVLKNEKNGNEMNQDFGNEITAVVGCNGSGRTIRMVWDEIKSSSTSKLLIVDPHGYFCDCQELDADWCIGVVEIYDGVTRYRKNLAVPVITIDRKLDGSSIIEATDFALKSDCLTTVERMNSIGIIGFGKIGEMVAKSLKDLNFDDWRVLIYDKDQEKLSLVRKRKVGVPTRSIVQIFKKCQLIFCCSRKRLINDNSFPMMQDNVFIVNCNRSDEEFDMKSLIQRKPFKETNFIQQYKTNINTKVNFLNQRESIQDVINWRVEIYELHAEIIFSGLKLIQMYPMIRKSDYIPIPLSSKEKFQIVELWKKEFSSHGAKYYHLPNQESLLKLNDILEAIRNNFSHNNLVILRGPEGSGKTSQACSYARTSETMYNQVFYFSSTSNKLKLKIDIESITNEIIDATEKHPVTQLYKYIGTSDYTSLIIFDGIESYEDCLELFPKKHQVRLRVLLVLNDSIDLTRFPKHSLIDMRLFSAMELKIFRNMHGLKLSPEDLSLVQGKPTFDMIEWFRYFKQTNQRENLPQNLTIWGLKDLKTTNSDAFSLLIHLCHLETQYLENRLVQFICLMNQIPLNAIEELRKRYYMISCGSYFQIHRKHVQTLFESFPSEVREVTRNLIILFENANVSIQQQGFSFWLKMVNHLSQLYSHVELTIDKVRLSMQLGMLYFQLSGNQENILETGRKISHQYFQAALSLLETSKLKDSILFGKIYLYLGKTANSSNLTCTESTREAEYYFAEAHDRLTFERTPELHVELLIAMVQYYVKFSTERPDADHDILNQTYDVARELFSIFKRNPQFSDLSFQVFQSLAGAYVIKGKPLDALKYYSKALDISNSKEARAILYRDRAKILQINHDWVGAEHDIRDAIALREETLHPSHKTVTELRFQLSDLFMDRFLHCGNGLEAAIDELKNNLKGLQPRTFEYFTYCKSLGYYCSAQEKYWKQAQVWSDRALRQLEYLRVPDSERKRLEGEIYAVKGLCTLPIDTKYLFLSLEAFSQCENVKRCSTVIWKIKEKLMTQLDDQIIFLEFKKYRQLFKLASLTDTKEERPEDVKTDTRNILSENGEGQSSEGENVNEQGVEDHDSTAQKRDSFQHEEVYSLDSFNEAMSEVSALSELTA